MSKFEQHPVNWQIRKINTLRILLQHIWQCILHAPNQLPRTQNQIYRRLSNAFAFNIHHPLHYKIITHFHPGKTCNILQLVALFMADVMLVYDQIINKLPDLRTHLDTDICIKDV